MFNREGMFGVDFVVFWGGEVSLDGPSESLHVSGWFKLEAFPPHVLVLSLSSSSRMWLQKPSRGRQAPRKEVRLETGFKYAIIKKMNF